MTDQEQTPALMFPAQPGTVLRVFRQASEKPITVKTEDLPVLAWEWTWNADLGEGELWPWVLGAGRGYRWMWSEGGSEILDVAIEYRPQSLSEIPIGLHPSWRILGGDEEGGEESESAAM